MNGTMCGIRGAIGVSSDTAEEIRARSVELLRAIFDGNGIGEDDAVSLIISATSDLKALNPATAMREAGYEVLPLFCVREAEFAGSPCMMIRMLMHVALPAGRRPVHAYLGSAAALRPDLASASP
ncbi:MAG: chorismate mutase [Spirochaetes bacterium]|nr:chorismate mutase [Spirochaetota bacterium]